MSTIKLPDGRKVDEKLYRERFLWPLDARWSSCKDQMQPCRICFSPAFKCTPHGENASRPTQCDGCWEVTSRLEAFLRDGGSVAGKIVVDALSTAGACRACGRVSDRPCHCENDE
jgi:hypothetical protein